MRYLVRERLFDIKDDFWVTDERGGRAFYVNAKLVSLHHTLVLEDASGRKLASIKHRLLTFTDAIDIEHDGAVVATVHRAIFSPLHPLSIAVPGRNPDLQDSGRHEMILAGISTQAQRIYQRTGAFRAA